MTHDEKKKEIPGKEDTKESSERKRNDYDTKECPQESVIAPKRAFPVCM